jgi:hypothetical protein
MKSKLEVRKKCPSVLGKIARLVLFHFITFVTEAG